MSMEKYSQLKRNIAHKSNEYVSARSSSEAKTIIDDRNQLCQQADNLRNELKESGDWDVEKSEN